MSATGLMDPESKDLRRAFKARRRTELGLLVAASVIITCAYALMIYGNTAKVPNDVAPLLAVMLGLGAVAHLANRIFVPSASPVVLPIAFLLNGLGYVMILRIDLANALLHYDYAPLQAAWTAGGVAAYVITLAVIRRSRDLDRYRYLLLALGVILLLLPLVPHLGINPALTGGARLWVHVGRFEFQPVELAKILLVIFFASYFAEKRELLTIPTARFGNRLVVDPRPLIPILLAWVFAIGVMSLEHDIGFSALLFTLFIGMLWVTTGRTGYLVLGVVLFAIGAYLSGRYLVPDPHPDRGLARPLEVRPDGSGDQLVQSWYSLGSGGIGGCGPGPGQPGRGRSPWPTPTSSSPSSARRWASSVRPWWWSPSCSWSAPAAHRPGGAVRVRQADRGGPDHDRRLPGVLHHRRHRPAPPADRDHPALRLLRGLRPHRQLRAHRHPHAHLRRGWGRGRRRSTRNSTSRARSAAIAC